MRSERENITCQGEKQAEPSMAKSTNLLTMDETFNRNLEILLGVTEKSGNLRTDLKMDILDSISSLRGIYINLVNIIVEKELKINEILNQESSVYTQIETLSKYNKEINKSTNHKSMLI